MRIEVQDKQSGAILFKKDEDSKQIDVLTKKVTKLESKIKDLETRLKALESK